MITSEYDLYRIIRDYGEDRFAKNIAKHIVMEREKNPIETTGQLNEVIRRAIPMKFQKNGGIRRRGRSRQFGLN